jgi:hypothetical protein
MMIDNRYLNFEDEFFLRGVECNIPPGSIGILPVDRVRGIKFMESKLLEIFYDMSAIYGKNIRDIFNTFKTRVFW